MSPKQVAAFRLDKELMAAMQTIEERDGVPVAEQMRRGVKLWLESKGVKLKPIATEARRRRAKSS